MDYNSAALNPPAPKSAETRLVIGPNASLSIRQAWQFMAVTATMGFGVAIMLALQGFWLVLPFAGLELAALGAALYVSVRRNGYREVLVFGPECLRVEFGMLGQGARTVIELQRAPTRVLIEPGPNRHAPSRLILSCVGQRVCIGTCLTDDERRHLASRIKELLIPGWHVKPASPGLLPVQESRFGE